MNGNITSATLRVFTTNTTANLRARVFAVLGDTWLESTGTGSNTTPIYAAYPLFDGANNGSLLPTSGGAYLEISSAALRDFVRREYARDGIVSLAVRMSSGTASFQTREAVNRPQLLINTAEAVAPTLLASSYDSSTAPHTLRFSFSEDVSQSLAASDLLLANLTNPSANVIINTPIYDGATHTATFSFDPSILPDGRYVARLPSGSVSDAAGNTLLADASLSFFYLQGDINNDAIIDIGDFGLLASRFNSAGTYAEGDINYDGAIDIGDFAILAARFNQSLPAAGDSARVANSKSPAPSPTFVFQSRRLIGEIFDSQHVYEGSVS